MTEMPKQPTVDLAAIALSVIAAKQRKDPSPIKREPDLQMQSFLMEMPEGSKVKFSARKDSAKQIDQFMINKS
jgi:hypothetical protein